MSAIQRHRPFGRVYKQKWGFGCRVYKVRDEGWGNVDHAQRGRKDWLP